MTETKIKKLPPEAMTMLQTGIVITDAVQCVLELVYNSLDAQATVIVIRVDLANYKIQVIDNGQGISQEDLTHIGEKFMTSKYESHCNTVGFSTYGFKGQAISSLLDVCKKLKIETKTQKDNMTLIKVFKDKMPLPIEHKFKSTEAGTSVTIEDFMWSLPVRRKRIHEIFDLEEIKTQLKYLAIIHYQVSFTLRNDNKTSVLFQTQSAPNILISVKNIFGASVSKALKKIKQTYKTYKISGFVSKKPIISNNVQLVYINKKLITKGMIHKVIIDIMNNYLKRIESNSSTSSGEKDFLLKKSKLASFRAFILKISCPKSCYELFTNMRKCTVEFKAWKDVLKAIQKAIKEAFCQNNNITISNDNNLVANQREERNEKKKKHGTSLLVNAIKGVAVKRYSKPKDSHKKTKGFLPKKQKKALHMLIPNEEIDKKLKDIAPQVKQPLAEKFQNEKSSIVDQSIDSMESPIPRKKLKAIMKHGKHNDVNEEMELAQNQSFLKFYKWLKKKIEEDLEAFKFHQNYLQFREKNESFQTNCFALPKSLVPTDQGNRNEIFNMYKTVNTVKEKDKFSNSHILISRERNILPQVDEKTTRKFRFENANEIQINGNTSNIWKYLFIENDQEDWHDDFKRASNVPQPYNPSVSKSHQIRMSELPQYVEKNTRKTLQISDQSYEFFSNYLDFRNFTDEWSNQPKLVEKQRLPDSETTTNPCTWKSHYRKTTRSTKNIGDDEGVEKQLIKESTTVDKRQESPELEFSFCIQETQNQSLGIHEWELPSTSSICVQHSLKKKSSKRTDLLKKDAMIQTDDTNPFMVSKSTQLRSGSFQKLNDSVPVSQSDSHFWNQSEGANTSQKKETSNNTSLIVDTNCKNSDVEETVCGQLRNKTLSKEVEDTLSKDTIAGIWTNSLKRLKDSVGRSSHSFQQSSPQVTPTIPIEDIDLGSLRLETPKFQLVSRMDCIPKGLSPMISNAKSIEMRKLNPKEKSEIQLAVDQSENEFLALVKWQDDSSGSSTKPVIPDRILDELRQKAERNMINFNSAIPSASISYCAIKVHNLLHSFAFTKELLSDVQIIGQLDKKFIVAKMNVSVPKKRELIALFDQHAVDERIKLEDIINENVLNDGKIKSTCLNSKFECELNESLVHILSSLNDAFLNIGLGYKVIGEKTVVIDEIPTLLAAKYAKDINNKNYSFVKKFIQQLITDAAHELTETRGVPSQFPKILYNLFCSEACHNAIRFNKFLTQEIMSDMVNRLKDCKLPFQCAHGRPSVIPIIDLQDLNSLAIDEINHEKFKSFALKKSRF